MLVKLKGLFSNANHVNLVLNSVGLYTEGLSFAQSSFFRLSNVCLMGGGVSSFLLLFRWTRCPWENAAMSYSFPNGKLKSNNSILSLNVLNNTFLSRLIPVCRAWMPEWPQRLLRIYFSWFCSSLLRPAWIWSWSYDSDGFGEIDYIMTFIGPLQWSIFVLLNIIHHYKPFHNFKGRIMSAIGFLLLISVKVISKVKCLVNVVKKYLSWNLI